VTTEKKLDHLTSQLTKAYGSSLLSVVLYGSAAAGDHHARYSDLNILCVLSRLTLAELDLAEPVFRWWRDQGNPAPLLLARDELTASTDCFPIEFHDIRRCHKILHGEDLVATLEIHDHYYRAQLEYQLRAKLLRLRQKAPGVLHDKDLLLALMADSVSTFANLARHVLLISGHDAPISKRDSLPLLHQHFSIDPAPFLTILDLREGKLTAKSLDSRTLFAQYLNGVETLADAVDRLH